MFWDWDLDGTTKRTIILFKDGFKMSHPGIEGHNFEYWEYLGEQTLTLT
jgi:hypothetical protein